ncbi:hypothetical protein H4Q26_012677 [Puccinia striiformis f. sp. tritici PST-130]|nr:hypothetical protein H4Q26_005241 [Puccinia striiformis f. sp. tritici PST-130]KAI9617813.1 hypothetical protein H4Q26_012677 [Puccinia striiformis f. sp. tritici PST-130]
MSCSQQQSYNTSSNLRRIIKIPGGKLAYLPPHKQATTPKCGDCHMGLPGIPALRPVRYANFFIMAVIFLQIPPEWLNAEDKKTIQAEIKKAQE